VPERPSTAISSNDSKPKFDWLKDLKQNVAKSKKKEEPPKTDLSSLFQLKKATPSVVESQPAPSRQRTPSPKKVGPP